MTNHSSYLYVENAKTDTHLEIPWKSQHNFLSMTVGRIWNTIYSKTAYTTSETEKSWTLTLSCFVFQKQVKNDNQMRPKNFLLLDLDPHLCAFFIISWISFMCRFSGSLLMYYDACVFPQGKGSSNLLLFTFLEYVFSIGLYRLIHKERPYNASGPFSHLWSPKPFFLFSVIIAFYSHIMKLKRYFSSLFGGMTLPAYIWTEKWIPCLFSAFSLPK